MKKQTAKKSVALKPNSARLKKWVAALESGKYSKIEDSLKGERSNQFCALGVGMKVFELETGTKLSYDGWGDDGWGNNLLPKKVKDWFGLKSRDPKICVTVKTKDIEHKTCNSISCLNDGGLWVDEIDRRIRIDFKTIAAGIRKTFNLK